MNANEDIRIIKEDKVFISSYITKEQKRQLQDYCKNNDLTMSQTIKKMIKNFLRENAENGNK